MTALTTADLDLFRIREHVKADHPTKTVRTSDGKPMPRGDLARLHATWHSRTRSSDDPRKQMPGVGHKHGGDVTSVMVAPGLFSIHPLGCFTGRDTIQEGK